MLFIEQMKDSLTGKQFQLIQAIVQNDLQQFCDLRGLFWQEIKIEIGDDGLFPLALSVIFGHKMMA